VQIFVRAGGLSAGRVRTTAGSRSGRSYWSTGTYSTYVCRWMTTQRSAHQKGCTFSWWSSTRGWS